MSTPADPERRRIDVVGVVQGVGFRPHVARLAHDLGLAGSVCNTGEGVRIEVQGDGLTLARFGTYLVADAPPLSRIEHTVVTSIDPIDSSETLDFTIDASTAFGTGLAAIPPDTATCESCLFEMRDPTNRRYRHPFITCTNCGPRWTIVTGLPYDRPRTTMADFELCSTCHAEYHDPTDRRYHAQPISCHDCGPGLQRMPGETAPPSTTSDEIIAATQLDLIAGRIVALKGIGGFHLAVDATDDNAVARLRTRKHRPDKPFAVMVRDLATAMAIVDISPEEADLLIDPARPIVLLRARRSETIALSTYIAPGSPVIGIMLPYTPLHHLLFATAPDHGGRAPTALVMTSGNVAGEPIVHTDDEVLERLGQVADSFCTHDRPIARPCDDSVVKIVDGHQAPIRRSRGYVPLPVTLPFDGPPLLAMGGDLKNTCCVISGHQALISQHLGDMDSLLTQQTFGRAADDLAALHGIEPCFVVADAHPSYRTAALARQRGLEVVSVGHHHAHLAALLAEHSMDPAQPVIGFAFDGTGWGRG